MNKHLFKRQFFAWIILALLSACSSPSVAQVPPIVLPTQAITNTGPTTPVQPSAAPIVLPSPTAQSSSNTNPKPPAYWPTQDWRISTPEQQGMDSAQISKVFDAIQKSNQNVHSVIIIRNGYIVSEAYYSPFRPDARHNLNTNTESIVPILIGIAIQEGFIKGVDQKMLDFFPDRKIANLDARKQAITIQDLLSMTSGLMENDSDMENSDDWVQFALDLPMELDPGKVWNENRGGSHLLSAIIQKATGMTTLAFANKVLFGPLGITEPVWLADPHGVNYGGSLLYLTSRDMAKIGYLYLNHGEWDGKQIVPKEYVLASTKRVFDVTGHLAGSGYGYGWYIAPDGSYRSEGFYGQLISVNPEQGIVTVFTGGADENFSSTEEHLVDQFLVPAVKSAGALPENQANIAQLNDKITALEKPVPQTIPPLSKLAQTISGKKYLMDDGETFKLTFAKDQATLDWSLKDHSMHFPLGMDNVFLTTPHDQTEDLSLFGATQPPLGHIFLAFKGSWTSDDTFTLNLQILNSTKSHTMTFVFTKDKVNIIHSQTDTSDTVSFLGQVQGP